MFPIARAHVERVVLVSDPAIRCAQQALWNTARVVTEPGAAASVAALLEGAYARLRPASASAWSSAARTRPPSISAENAGRCSAARYNCG